MNLNFKKRKILRTVKRSKEKEETHEQYMRESCAGVAVEIVELWVEEEKSLEFGDDVSLLSGEQALKVVPSARSYQLAINFFTFA
jgi:hypothetical protein